jgi:uncharacterized protein (TIGR02466 family)
MPEELVRWTHASDVIPLFPTIVWRIDLNAESREAINAEILSALARMRANLPPLATGQGWQSTQSLHELEEFRRLFACVHRAVAGILRFLRVGYEAFEVTACWATVLASGAEHRAHYHPNNFLSGVYYVRTHPGADTINFHDPRESDRDHPPTGSCAYRREHGPGRRASERWNTPDISVLLAALRHRKCEPRREDQHQLQHHVFCIH